VQLPDFARPVLSKPDNSWEYLPVSLVLQSLDRCNPIIHIALVSEKDGAVSPWVKAGKRIPGWSYSPLGSGDADALALGSMLISNAYKLQGQIAVPPGFEDVGAVLVRVTWENSVDHTFQHFVDQLLGQHNGMDAAYIDSIVLKAPDHPDHHNDTNKLKGSSTIIPIHSFVYEPQGTRVFFRAEAKLPGETPPALMLYRNTDLEVTQGIRSSIGADGSAPPQPPFHEWHRVYQYDVYNDLGGDPSKYPRPTLGGSELPYPRRLRTGRPYYPGTQYESNVPSGQTPYLPKNETFSKIRQQGFNGDVFKNVALSALNVIKDLGRGGADFKSFHDLRKWFSDKQSNSMIGSQGAAAITAKSHPGFKWPAPDVYKDRPDLWRADFEFGRQTVAGQNPVTIEAVHDLSTDGAFSSFKVSPLLTDGSKLEDLVEIGKSDPRKCVLFQQNYESIFVDYAEKVSEAHKGRVLCGLRVLLYADKSKRLRPVAIELRRDSSPQTEPEVYTPLDGVGVWMLAKAFVNTNDSAMHQVVSHWLRSHACVEAFIIASRRQLSLAHPINRLLQKHTVYTLQINAMARVALVNAGGIIERTFTPGRYSMELGSQVYAAKWTFENQALPQDLIARGMAVRDDSKACGVSLVESIDYPFGEDALELWTLIHGWIGDYVNIYYKNDDAVVQDSEVMAWWDDIKNCGHPDKHEGWPELKGTSSLTDILSTIVWLASAHHAAVNFGQYDFSGFLLNRSSKVRKPFPKRGSEEFKRLAVGIDYEEMEEVVLSYLPGPVDYATVLAVVEVLSKHDDNEAYLGNPDPWITKVGVRESAAMERYQQFAEDLKALETAIKDRNNDPQKVNRAGDFVLDYTLLSPSSSGGITRRGVPNSISI
jgi:hypothetical protein